MKTIPSWTPCGTMKCWRSYPDISPSSFIKCKVLQDHFVILVIRQNQFVMEVSSSWSSWKFWIWVFYCLVMRIILFFIETNSTFSKYYLKLRPYLRMFKIFRSRHYSSVIHQLWHVVRLSCDLCYQNKSIYSIALLQLTEPPPPPPLQMKKFESSNICNCEFKTL